MRHHRVLMAWLFALWWAVPAAAAPALDGETIISEQYVSGGDTWTSATNKTTAGTNRVAFLVIAGIYYTTAGGNAATYCGNAMTLVSEVVLDSGTEDEFVSIWKYVDPATTACAVTFDLASSFYGAVMVFSVKDAGTIDGINTNTGTTDNPTVDVTSETGDFVIVGISTNTGDPAVGAGQTQIAENHYGGAYYGQTSHEDGASTVTMSATATSGGWVAIGFNINAVAAGGCSSRMSLLGVGQC